MSAEVGAMASWFLELSGALSIKTHSTQLRPVTYRAPCDLTHLTSDTYSQNYRCVGSLAAARRFSLRINGARESQLDPFPLSGPHAVRAFNLPASSSTNNFLG